MLLLNARVCDTQQPKNNIKPRCQNPGTNINSHIMLMPLPLNPHPLSKPKSPNHLKSTKKSYTVMSSSKRRNKSICQKSTIIAANLIRASSFVLAKMALGSSQGNSGISRGVGAKVPVTETVMRPKHMLYTEAVGSQMNSYVMEPENDDGINARCKKFIDKVRKNRSNLSTEDYVANCLPPPPVRKPAVSYGYRR
jgi:hypothetical protein